MKTYTFNVVVEPDEDRWHAYCPTDYAQLHGLTARELIAALIRDGFVLDRQAGSYRLYLHQDGRRATVRSQASGETFRRKTLQAMVERRKPIGPEAI